MLGSLRRALEGHFGGLVASRGAQNDAAQPQCFRVRLDRERAVEGEQRAIGIAHAMRRVAELVPGHAEIGIALERLFEGAERFAVALQLDQRGAAQRERQAGGTEVAEGCFGEAERLVGAAGAAQQLEAFGPARFQVGLGGEHGAVRALCVAHAALLRQPARARDDALVRDVGEEIERRGGAHGR